MDLINKMKDIVTPKFCEDVLRKSENDPTIKVTHVTLRPATNKGDNYTSDMFRVTVDYLSSTRNEEEKKSIIVKVEPIVEGIHQQLVAKARIFSVEMQMMTDTLRKMNDILGAGPNRLNARALYAQEKPPMIVMEDLMPLGFRMADRQAGLDVEHCLLAIRNLARFHGSSVALCEKDESIKKRYHRGLFNANQPDEMKIFFIEGTKELVRELATWPEIDKKYSEKIAKIQDQIYQIACDACAVDEDEFNVLNHGDFWVNNSLFKYDENGRPIQHIFVDFQFCLYSSPAVDLIYFFNTSTTDEVWNKNEDMLLKEYLKTLSVTMARAGSRKIAPTLEELKAMMKKCYAYGMVASFTLVPTLLVDKSDAKSLQEMSTSEGTFVNPAYKGKLYRKTILKRLPIYEEMGLLD